MLHIQKDKQMHFNYSCLIALLAGICAFFLGMNLIQFLFTSLGISFATGVGKEYGDHINPNNKWDWYDILADALGAICGTLISSTLLLI